VETATKTIRLGKKDEGTPQMFMLSVVKTRQHNSFYFDVIQSSFLVL